MGGYIFQRTMNPTKKRCLDFIEKCLSKLNNLYSRMHLLFMHGTIVVVTDHLMDIQGARSKDNKKSLSITKKK